MALHPALTQRAFPPPPCLRVSGRVVEPPTDTKAKLPLRTAVYANLGHFRARILNWYPANSKS